MNPKLISAAAAALLAMSGSAFAAMATATTDLNIRSGPGPQFDVIGVIGAGKGVDIQGCIEGSKWCTVAAKAGQGWVYSDYLTSDFGGKQVVLTDRPGNSEIAVVRAPQGAAIDGTVTGALVTGPGGAVGAAAEPPTTVRTYVTAHKTRPIYLDGETVVGAALPDGVDIREIPDYQYRYVYLNGQPVLVDPGSRRIVYVLR